VSRQPSRRPHPAALPSPLSSIHPRFSRCATIWQVTPSFVILCVCRHGQTVLLAIALSSKEATTDYEWQLQCYLEAVGIPPQLLLTDADPGVCAAVASILPLALHLWCLWHLHQNLRKHLMSALDNHLTPNVRYWAGFRHTRFSTGAVSTQRGEGLNRHFKAHLSGQSPLSKLFDQVLLGG